MVHYGFGADMMSKSGTKILSSLMIKNATLLSWKDKCVYWWIRWWLWGGGGILHALSLLGSAMGWEQPKTKPTCLAAWFVDQMLLERHCLYI
jgi:hypothetical protein